MADRIELVVVDHRLQRQTAALVDFGQVVGTERTAGAEELAVDLVPRLVAQRRRAAQHPELFCANAQSSFFRLRILV